jgi:hypothetical protein
MVARIFDVPGLLIVLGITALAFLLPTIIGAIRGTSQVLQGVEAAILSLVGGLLARSFISLMMGAAHDSAGCGLAVGWGFFLVPGLVDTFASHPILTTPEVLMLLGGIVGAFTGMMAGIYQIYDWEGLGYLAFPLDVTWALAGNTVAALMHIVNIGWGDHGAETRENAHRYASGFGLRPGYAFTQGCVMSNLSEGPGDPLFRHERTHVWQNRAFGPLYTLTYIGWMLVWVVPAVIAGIIVMGIRGIGAGPNNWCYFNNPWEAWAYAVQEADRTSIIGVGEDDRKMIWPARFVVAWAIPFFLVCIALTSFTAYKVWMTPSAPVTPVHAASHSHAAPPKAPSHPKH